MKYWLTSLFALSFILVAAQEKRQLLKGTLLYRNTSVVAANVVNNTAQTNTITDGEGTFEILAKVGDEVIFSSVEFRIKALTITPEIIQKNRLVVEVNERITVLDEIVVGPENTQKFLDLKKEEFSKVDYTQDKSTKIDNTILRQGQLVNGLNIVNVVFFTKDLGLSQDEVIGFLEEMDKKLPSDRLLKKDKEFQLIEFLYLESEQYKKQIR